MAKPTSRRWTLLLTVMATVLISVPTAVWAGHQFNDVPDDHIFHTGISWMKDNNITVGCNPPANNQYCPEDNVTRGQMATFMKRLAENNVVDAATLDGKDSTDLQTVVAMLQLSTFDGTDLGLEVVAGPFTGPSLDIEVPAAGVVLVQSTSSWDVGDYVITSWTEVDTSTPCDTRFDGDPMPGSFGAANSDAADGNAWGANTVGQGSFPVTTAGTHTIHLCFTGFAVVDGGADLDYGITATWIPSDSATVAPAVAGSNDESPSGGASGTP